MSPTLLVIVLSVVGLAIFLAGVAMMARRQEGGGARRPALLMVGGIAVLILGLLAALVLKWTETPSSQPRFEIPGTGIASPAPPATTAPAPPATAPAPAR